MECLSTNVCSHISPSKFPLTYWIICILGKSTVLVIQKISLFHSKFALILPAFLNENFSEYIIFFQTLFSSRLPAPNDYSSAILPLSNYDSVTSTRQTRFLLWPVSDRGKGEAFLKKKPLEKTAFQEGEQTRQRKQSRNKSGVLKTEGVISVPHRMKQAQAKAWSRPGAVATS